MATVSDIAAENKRQMPPNDSEAEVQGKISGRLEKLAFLSETLGSQQEYQDLLKGIDALIKTFSKDRLEDVLPPKTVVIQKGRPKNTKREKLGIEHEDIKIKQERSQNKKEKRKVVDDFDDVNINTVKKKKTKKTVPINLIKTLQQKYV